MNFPPLPPSHTHVVSSLRWPAQISWGSALGSGDGSWEEHSGRNRVLVSLVQRGSPVSSWLSADCLTLSRLQQCGTGIGVRQSLGLVEASCWGSKLSLLTRYPSAWPRICHHRCPNRCISAAGLWAPFPAETGRQREQERGKGWSLSDAHTFWRPPAFLAPQDIGMSGLWTSQGVSESRDPALGAWPQRLISVVQKL